jgi:ribokinase
MTKFLQELLTTNEPLFPTALAQLEKSTGNAGIDVRLIADIRHKAHEVMRKLGLDPADTNGHELYQALNSFIMRTDRFDILENADFVLMLIDGEVISFNLIDIIENAHHELHFDKRIYSHGQRSLRGEIVQRYVDNPQTHESTTHTLALDAGLIQPDDEWYSKENTSVIGKKDGSPDMKPYILAVGDIFTDAFIKLDEQYARIDTDHDGSKRLSLPFGSKPPYERVDIVKAVGPSPNAAISCARLGLDVGLVAWLGDDDAGKESLAHLASENVDTSQMVTEKDKKSSYWYVLRFGADRTMLVKSESYQYKWQAPSRAPDWIYLSYIGEDSWPLHEELLKYLEKHPETKLAFQPGTYHFEWGVEKLREIYKRSHIVVMNREEAVDVTGKSYDSLKDLFQGLHDLGPQAVVITDGPNGSYASHDWKMFSIPNYPDPAPPLDRTGAGDAFASTIVAALALGETIETALTWAPINSMNVVQKIGAQAGLLHIDEINEYISKAPDWYHAEEIQG